MATDGWLEKFLFRHNLVSRRPTCQKEPEEYDEKIVDYLLFVEQQRQSSNYTYIYAVDEIAVLSDYSNSLTVVGKGVREVIGKTSGPNKLHVTVILMARSDGFKCRPYVLLNNKRPIKEIVDKLRHTLCLCWAGRSFFNDDLTVDVLQKILGYSLFGMRLLVLNSYRCHISDATKKHLNNSELIQSLFQEAAPSLFRHPTSTGMPRLQVISDSFTKIEWCTGKRLTQHPETCEPHLWKSS